MKPRVCETVLVRSHKPGLFTGTAGKERFVTPQEADLLVLHGLAVRVQKSKPQEDEPVAPQPVQTGYLHREMTVQQQPQRPAQPKQHHKPHKKHRKG